MLGSLAFADNTQKVCFASSIKVGNVGAIESSDSSSSYNMVYSAYIPNPSNGTCLIVDAGANLENKSEMVTSISNRMESANIDWGIGNMVSSTNSKNTPVGLRFWFTLSAINFTIDNTEVTCENFSLGQGDITGGYSLTIIILISLLPAVIVMAINILFILVDGRLLCLIVNLPQLLRKTN